MEQTQRIFTFASDYMMFCSIPDGARVDQCAVEAKYLTFHVKKLTFGGVVKGENHTNSSHIFHQCWKTDCWTKR